MPLQRSRSLEGFRMRVDELERFSEMYRRRRYFRVTSVLITTWKMQMLSRGSDLIRATVQVYPSFALAGGWRCPAADAAVVVAPRGDSGVRLHFSNSFTVFVLFRALPMVSVFLPTV